jgi:hypothetical protein
MKQEILKKIMKNLLLLIKYINWRYFLLYIQFIQNYKNILIIY